MLTPDRSIVNVLTIDVEDYFHVSAFESVCDPCTWAGRECRVEANTTKILGILGEHSVRATFFVLGLGGRAVSLPGAGYRRRGPRGGEPRVRAPARVHPDARGLPGRRPPGQGASRRPRRGSREGLQGPELLHLTGLPVGLRRARGRRVRVRLQRFPRAARPLRHRRVAAIPLPTGADGRGRPGELGAV